MKDTKLPGRCERIQESLRRSKGQLENPGTSTIPITVWRAEPTETNVEICPRKTKSHDEVAKKPRLGPFIGTDGAEAYLKRICSPSYLKV